MLNHKIKIMADTSASLQVLFQNKLFGYFQNETWRCVNKKCSATVSVEFATEIIIDISRVKHLEHADKSLC